MTDIPTPEQLHREIEDATERMIDDMVSAILQRMRESRTLRTTLQLTKLTEGAEAMIKQRLEEKGWKVEVTRVEKASVGFFTKPATITMKVRAPGVGDDQ